MSTLQYFILLKRDKLNETFLYVSFSKQYKIKFDNSNNHIKLKLQKTMKSAGLKKFQPSSTTQDLNEEKSLFTRLDQNLPRTETRSFRR